MNNPKNTKDKHCPKCKEEVQGSAKKCKHCGADLRKWFMRHPIFYILVFLFVILPIFISGFGGNGEADIKKDAIAVARVFVENYLEYPADSQFPGLDYGILKKEDNIYVIKDYVLVANAFGIKEKKQYIMQLKYKGGDANSINNWEQVDFSFIE